QPTVRLALAWPQIVLALVRPQRRGPLGLRCDRQRRVDPEVRRDGRAICDEQRRVAVHPLVWVDDPVLRAVADRGAAEEVRGQRDVEQLAPSSAGDPVDLGGDAAGHLVADRDPGWVRLAVALLADIPAAPQLAAFG